MWRAAEATGIDDSEAMGVAEAEGLVDLTAGAAFCHLLVRSAVYGVRTVGDRREAHIGRRPRRTDPAVGPDRRAWHRAQAASRRARVDVAADLETLGWASPSPAAGSRRRPRPGNGRHRKLSVDAAPACRGGRSLPPRPTARPAPARCSPRLAAAGRARPPDDAQCAQLDLLRAQISPPTPPAEAAVARDAPAQGRSAPRRL